MKNVNTVQGKETMERFKMEAANEVGVNLKNGYNGDLTSREAGSVGGQMVKKMIPEQRITFKRLCGRKFLEKTYNTYVSIPTHKLNYLQE